MAAPSTKKEWELRFFFRSSSDIATQIQEKIESYERMVRE